MAFEVFDPPPANRRHGKRPNEISLYPSGSFGLLVGFWTTVPDYKHKRMAELLWDKNKRRIGFAFYYDVEAPEHCFRLGYVGPSSHTLACRVFFDKFDLNPIELAGRYSVHRGKREGRQVYYICLGERKKR